MRSQLPDLSPRELEAFGFARAKDIAFDAVQNLWKRRQAEGLKQTDLANTIDWDPAVISRKLQGPSNWTLRTLGAFVEALNGELEINICAVEDPVARRGNYHAYAGYEVIENPVFSGAMTVSSNNSSNVVTSSSTSVESAYA